MNKPRPVDAYQTDATVSDPKVGGAKAFGALAGYLFGKNQESTSMAMTTPVINRGEADAKTMSFVLPSEFWNDGRNLQRLTVQLDFPGGQDLVQRIVGEIQLGVGNT